MPYDSVYLEKRPPGALRTVWRKFYGDTTAMIGLYGCAALALLCVFGGWFAPYGIDQQFLGSQLLPTSSKKTTSKRCWRFSCFIPYS